MGASGTEPSSPPGAEGSARLTPANALVLVAVILLALFLIPLAIEAYRLPVGADVPYYAWSTRLAGESGLSVTDFRPGLHALLLALSGATGLEAFQLIGAAAVALAVGIGLATTVLAERGFGRDPWTAAAAGVAAGAYAARMASGFLANLLFALLFTAALAAIVGRHRRPSAILGAVLLGAAGLAHGLFLVLGAGVLAVAAIIRAAAGRRTDPEGVRSDLTRLGGAAAGGGLIAVAGFLLASLGRPLGEAERVHTRDALVRRAGLGDLVDGAYWARWREALRAFALPVTVPLAAAGAAAVRANPLLDPLFAATLGGWFLVSVAGILGGLATAGLPAGRVLNFALVLPILGAAGIVGLARWIGARRAGLGRALGAILMIALLWSPVRAWTETHPFTSATDLRASEAAGGYAATLPAGTPLLFVIDHHGPHAGFELSRFINVIRLGLPPDRQADAAFFVGGPNDYALRRPGLIGDREHDGIAADAFERAEPLLRVTHAPLLLRPFNQPGWAASQGTELAPGVDVLRRVLAADPPAAGASPPSNRGVSPALLWALTAGLLALLALVGVGWVRGLAPGLERHEIWALAPAAGAGALVLAGVALDAAGLAMGTYGAPAFLLALAAGLVLARRGRGG